MFWHVCSKLEACRGHHESGKVVDGSLVWLDCAVLGHLSWLSPRQEGCFPSPSPSLGVGVSYFLVGEGQDVKCSFAELA